MPKRQGRKRVRKMKGKGLKSLLQRGNKFLRDTKLVSRLAGTLRDAGIAPKYTGAISSTAGNLGYGRKRKRKMKGRGKVLDWIRNKALPFLKRTKIISGVSGALSNVPVIGGVAGLVQKGSSALGYGKRRGRVMRGRGIGHMYTPQSSVGIAGTTTYSSGRVQF